ncbi:MAG: cell division ATP-binding protein FtsE [Acidobacteria bacterium]|nr:cell division ATP-binding protein FtsE [Acidobacteriota bacterium]
MIRCFHVTKRYGAITALRDISLQIDEGEFVFLTGASGAGKTTLLRLLYRAELPTSGQLIVAGRNLATMPRRQVPRFRRRLGLVFQDFKLIDDRSVFDNVALVGRVVGLSYTESQRRANELLRLVGVDGRAQLFPAQISGGEQQRVAISRALMTAPQLLLADEPTGNLDPDRAIEIMRIFRAINRRGTTVLVATHDPDLIAAMRRRTLILEAGLMRTLTAARKVP